MKTFSSFFTLAALVLLSACADVGDGPRALTGEAVSVANAEGTVLAIDTSRSTVNWLGAKVTRTHDGGFHDFDGTVTVSGNDVTGVNLTIDMASLWTDTERLTGHLMSEDFFEVETYPTATFEASQFAPADSGGTHMVTGNLTMHGVTNGVTFPATINVEAGRVTARADFIINRRDWQINYDGQADDLIRDNVKIIFDIVAGDGMVADADVDAEATEE